MLYTSDQALCGPRLIFIGHVFCPFVLSGHRTNVSHHCGSSSIPCGVWQCHWRPDQWCLHQEVSVCALMLEFPRLTSCRTASYKALTIFGQVASSTAYLLLIAFWRGHTNIWESLYIGPGGFGTGVAMATTFVCLSAGVDEPHMAIASTGIYLSANIGSLIGTSLASSVLQTSLRNELKTRLEGFPDHTTVPLSRSYHFLPGRFGR